MEARSPHWRAAVFPIAFALLCVTLMIGTWVSFGGQIPFTPKGYRFRLPLPRATGVYPDTSVRIAGITVGKVVSVSLDGTRATALVEMQPSFAPVRRGARVIVRSKTLLGEGYIAMAPGPASAAPVPDGGTLPASDVEPTEQLFDALRVFTPDTRARLRSMFSGLAAAVAGRSQSLNDSLGYAGHTVTSFGSVFQTLRSQAASLSSLIADTGAVLSTLGSRSGVIESAVRAGDEALSVTAAGDRGLRATIAGLPGFLRQVRSTSDVLTAASGDISDAVGAASSATTELVPALRAIDSATPTFTELFRRLPGVMAVGERALPDLDRVLAQAGRSLPAIYTAAR